MLFGHADSSTCEDESSLLKRAASWPEAPGLQDLTAEPLAQISQRAGIDFATALLFDRFQRAPERAGFINRLNTLRRSTSPSRNVLDATVMIVPGALYIERPDKGGDGRLIRDVAEALGWKTGLIPLASLGSVRQNANLLRRWLEQKQHATEKIILVSLSKGGADLKLALGTPDAQKAALFRNVIAWVNICGPLDGTPMANWILASRLQHWFFRAKFWLQRRDFAFITDLRRGQGMLLDFSMSPPPGMKMISVMGFPLRRHMTTRLSRFCHRTLGVNGPNDGTTILADLLRWPGEIFPAWGMDHYFADRNEVKRLITALLSYIYESSSSSFSSSCSAPSLTTPSS